MIVGDAGCRTLWFLKVRILTFRVALLQRVPLGFDHCAAATGCAAKYCSNPAFTCPTIP